MVGARILVSALVVTSGCGEAGPTPPSPEVCEGSKLDPRAECPDGFCVDGSECQPIFDSCEGDTIPPLGGGCYHVGLPEDCWDGWVPDGDDGCEPILPKGECPMGTMPVIGQAECQPVGLPQDCWPGWVNDGDGGCEPILAASCAPGEMAMMGSSICRPMGDCGAPPPIGPTVRYVDATMGPYTTIQAAIADAAPGDTVFIAAGEYVENVSISTSLTLMGRCARDVTVRGMGVAASTLDVTPGVGSVAIRGLTLTGPGDGLRVQDRADVVIEDVAVDEPGGAGIEVANGSDVTIQGATIFGSAGTGLIVHGASVTSATDLAVTNGLDRGVRVQTAATLTLRRALIAANRVKGVSYHSASGDLEEIVVRDTLPDANGRWGWGVEAQAGADVEIRRARIMGNRDNGAVVANSTAAFEDVVVRDTGAQEQSGLFGWGVTMQDAQASLCRSLVTSNRHFGVTIDRSTVTVEHTVVRDTQPTQADETFGLGVGVTDSDVTFTRNLIEANRVEGMILFGATGSIEEVTVRDTQPDGDGSKGHGILVVPGVAPSDLAMNRLLLDANREVGLVISGSTATVDEIVVRNTSPTVAEEFGRGVVVQQDPFDGTTSNVVLRRSLLEDNSEIGLSVFRGSTAVIEDVIVRGTRPLPNGTWGHGVHVEGGDAPSEVALRRCLIASQYEAGLVVADSLATLEDVVIRDTRVGEDGGVYGDGLAIVRRMLPTQAVVSRSLVTGSARAAVLCLGATGSLSSSALEGNLIGVAMEGDCEMEIADDVSLVDNQTNRSFGLGVEPPPPPRPSFLDRHDRCKRGGRDKEARMGRFGLLILMVAGCGHVTAKSGVRRSQGDPLRGDLASVRVSVSSSGRVSIHGLDAGGVPVPTRVVAGTDNGPDRGYAIATTEDGEVVAVWYERAAGKSRLQVRRCNRSGHLLWTQAVDGDCTVIDTNGRVDVTRLSGVSGSGIPLLACHSS